MELKNILCQRGKKKKSSFSICFQYENITCCFKISCSKFRKNDYRGFFTFEKEENSILAHGTVDADKNTIDFCCSVGKLSIVSY